MRRLLVCLAPLILLAHTLITACVSPAVLLLSQHDHWVIGRVSAQQWAAHTQWHLKQLNGHYAVDGSSSTTRPAPDTSTAATGTILSAKGCDMQAMQAFYSTLRGLPTPMQAWGEWVATGNLPEIPGTIMRLKASEVPLPPPR